MDQSRAVIVNQNAGSVNNRRRLQKKLAKLGDIYQVGGTTNFIDVYKKVLARKPDVIVLAGGDGTFIEAVEWFHSQGYHGAYAVVPLGTSNYVARNLELPKTVNGAIERIQKGRMKELPVAQANDNYFMLYLAIGLSRDVAANVTDKLKKRFGQGAYLMELRRQSKNAQSFTYRIESPDINEVITGESHQLLLYNSNLNMQIHIAPKHSIEDPTLKLVVADTGKNIIKLFIAWTIMTLTFGKIKRYIRTYELTEAVVRVEPAQAADLDGEIKSSSPFYVSVLKDKIKVVC